jgi:hypothetical protein
VMGKADDFFRTHAKNPHCQCRASQPLVNDVFRIMTEMESRLDPAWAFRMKQTEALFG